jgi:moderate conductance mechanosensitive channel
VDILDLLGFDTWGELGRRLVGPVLGMLLIVVLASLVLRIARAAIRRSVERVKRGQPAWIQRLEDRSGSDDPILRVRRERRATALAGLASSVVTAVVWTIAVMMILDQFGFALAPVLASAGIVGIALGFGAQDLVKDFLSGVFILAEDQYGLGDVVDVGEASGVVEGVTLRSTRVRDVNGTLWHIPNGEIRRVGNQSQGWARSLLDVEVAYDTDLASATEAILAVATTMSHEQPWDALFLEEPEMWGVERLGPESVSLRLVIKVVPGEQWRISRELRRRIKEELDRLGIENPFRQRTMWLRGQGPPEPVD